MEDNKKIAILIMVLTGFIFGVSFSTLYAQTHINERTACSCTLPIPVLIPTFSSLGVFVGSLVYYFIPKRPNEVDKTVFLDLIEGKRKEVIKMLVENNGEILQSELSSKFGKVKAHRLVKKLKKEGAIEKEPYGKTNKVILKEKYGSLLEK